MWSSAALFILSNFMLSITRQNQYYAVLLSQGIGMGTALGLSWTPMFGMIGHRFRRHRDLAFGLTASGAAFGAIVHPIMLDRLFSNPNIGFHNAVRINAGMNAILVVVGTVLMTHASPPQKIAVVRGDMSLLHLFKDLPYVLFNFGLLCTQFGFLFPFAYLQLFSRTRGIPVKEAFYTLSIFNAAAVVGRLGSISLPKRMHAVEISCLASLGFSACMFAYISAQRFVDVVVVTSLVGIFSGAYFSYFVNSVASFARTRAYVSFNPHLVAPPLLGLLLTKNFIWEGPIVFASLMTMLSAGFFALSRAFQIRNLPRLEKMS
ncbi:MFS general substrate transporter [Sistotremastrum niveocremeum HHB9708]|uniref:MFS general substrate transporter n=1 Tax=Sistotremastrum niveocremeum HHB9708 TaxID=1314777 RepID=A0A164T6D1_9AGAM|nr:MFS general substrate transporter [Sistotremastrum niveocremeum HHB9708]